MTIKEQRKQLIDWVKTVDPVAFDSLEALMKQYPKSVERKKHAPVKRKPEAEDEINLAEPGPPMSLETFYRRIERSREQVRNGQTSTQEEVERESEEW